jgi:hypothetical protein
MAAVASAALFCGAAPLDPREIYAKKTSDMLLMCVNGGEMCRVFVNDVLKTLNVAAVIQPAKNYKGCAPAPLSSDQVDQLVLWLLSRPQLSSGYAAIDIGTAAEDLWPCK